MEEIRAVSNPAAEHVITFGQVADHSLPMRLFPDGGAKCELKAATGQYAHLRQPAILRQDELYAYLRLGIPANSALVLKALGYPTPESVSADPSTSALLPDMLVMPDRPYPAEFIDSCEQAGVPAPACEQSLRRGLSTHNTTGPLEPIEVVTLFTRILRRPISLVGAHAMAMDALCSGEVPLAAALWARGHVQLDDLACALRVLREPDNAPFLARLQLLPNAFARFLAAVPKWKARPEYILTLKRVVEDHGDEALDLPHPELCLARGADSAPAGLAAAQYVEAVMDARDARRHGWWFEQGSECVLVDTGWSHWDRREGEASERASTTVADLDRLRVAGVVPEVAAAWVFDAGRPAATLLTAATEGMSTALLDGAL